MRASTDSPSNEPDRRQDPVAWLAYRRARGALPSESIGTSSDSCWTELLRFLSPGRVDLAVEKILALPSGSVTQDQTEAIQLWLEACAHTKQKSRSANSAEAAFALLELASACPRAPGGLRSGPASSRRGDQRTRRAFAIAYAPGRVMRPIRSRSGLRRSAWGKPRRSWRDSSRRLAMLTVSSALWTSGRVITSTLGHCLHRVGKAVLQMAAAQAARGRTQAANGLLTSLVQGSLWRVDPLEAAESPPDIEEVVALEQVRSALDRLGESHHEALWGRVDRNNAKRSVASRSPRGRRCMD